MTETGETATARPSQTGRLLTTVQAAEVLAVSVRTVRNLMHDGKLHYVKVGSATRIDPVDVETFIARNRRKRRIR